MIRGRDSFLPELHGGAEKKEKGEPKRVGYGLKLSVGISDGRSPDLGTPGINPRWHIWVTSAVGVGLPRVCPGQYLPDTLYHALP